MNRNFLINYYCENYHNDAQIKKYEKPNINGITAAFDRLDDKYVYLIKQLFKKHIVKFCTDRSKGLCSFTLSDGKVKNTIVVKAEEKKVDTLFHELGHAFDSFIFEDGVAPFSYNYKDPDTGKYFDDLIKEEVLGYKNTILNNILNEFAILVDKEFGEGYFRRYLEAQKLIPEVEKYNRKLGGFIGRSNHESELYNTDTEYDKNKAIYDKLYNEAIGKEAYIVQRNVYFSEASKTINHRYCNIIDILSSVFETQKLYGLYGHSIKYYKKDVMGISTEFFANMFSDTMTNNTESIEGTAKFAPESVKMFTKLFKEVAAKEYGYNFNFRYKTT